MKFNKQILLFMILSFSLSLGMDDKKLNIAYNLAQMLFDKGDLKSLIQARKILEPYFESDKNGDALPETKIQALYRKIKLTLTIDLIKQEKSEKDQLQLLINYKHELLNQKSDECQKKVLSFLESWRPADSPTKVTSLQIAALNIHASLRFRQLTLKAINLEIGLKGVKDHGSPDVLLLQQDLEFLVYQDSNMDAKFEALLQLSLLAKDEKFQAFFKEYSDSFFDALIIEFIVLVKPIIDLPQGSHVKAAAMGKRLDLLLGMIAGRKDEAINKICAKLLGNVYNLFPLIRAKNAEQLKLNIINRLVVQSGKLIGSDDEWIIEPLLDFLEPSLHALDVSPKAKGSVATSFVATRKKMSEYYSPAAAISRLIKDAKTIEDIERVGGLLLPFNENYKRGLFSEHERVQWQKVFKDFKLTKAFLMFFSKEIEDYDSVLSLIQEGLSDLAVDALSELEIKALHVRASILFGKVLQCLATPEEQTCLILDLDTLIHQTIINEFRLAALIRLYCVKKEDSRIKAAIKNKLKSVEYFDVFINDLMLDITLTNPGDVPKSYKTLNSILGILGDTKCIAVEHLLGPLKNLLLRVPSDDVTPMKIKMVVIIHLLTNAQDLFNTEFEYIVGSLLDYIRPTINILKSNKDSSSRELYVRFLCLKALNTQNKEDLNRALKSLNRFKIIIRNEASLSVGQKATLRQEYVTLFQTRILKCLGRYAEADSKLLGCLKNSTAAPLVVLYTLERAHLLGTQKRYQEAIVLLDEQLKKQRNKIFKSNLFYWRGLLHRQEDKKEESIRDLCDAYEILHEIDDKGIYSKSIELYLAELFAQESALQSLEKSIKFYQKVIKDPINIEVKGKAYLGLARVHFQKNELEMVGKYLSKALELEELEDICAIARAMQAYRAFSENVDKGSLEDLVPFHNSLELFDKQWRVYIADALIYHYVHTFQFEKADSFIKKALKVCGKDLKKAQYFSFNRALVHFNRSEAQEGVEQLSRLVRTHKSSITLICNDIKKHLQAQRESKELCDKRYCALLSMAPCLLNKKFCTQADILESLDQWSEFIRSPVDHKIKKKRKTREPATIQDFNNLLKRNTQRFAALQKIEQGAKELSEKEFIEWVMKVSPALMP